MSRRMLRPCHLVKESAVPTERTLTRIPQRESRRRFLRTTAALASTLALPQIVPRSVFGSAAPSNRTHVGQIGCGHQSQRIVPSFLVHDDVQIVAVCDVNRSGLGSCYPDQVLGRETAKKWKSVTVRPICAFWATWPRS
jgi:hypothetical protein